MEASARKAAFVLSSLVLVGLSTETRSQSIVPSAPSRGPAIHPERSVVVPQARVYSAPERRSPIRIAGVEAVIDILDQVAATTLDVSIENPGPRPEEAELLLPVPAGVTVKSFLFEGTASEPTARLLPREEARARYESIVRQMRDPAILEFAGYSFIQTSVFPVPARGGQGSRSRGGRG